VPGSAWCNSRPSREQRAPHSLIVLSLRAVVGEFCRTSHSLSGRRKVDAAATRSQTTPGWPRRNILGHKAAALLGIDVIPVPNEGREQGSPVSWYFRRLEPVDAKCHYGHHDDAGWGDGLRQIREIANSGGNSST